MHYEQFNCTRAAREASSGRMGSGSPGESTERSSVEQISAISVLTLPIGISAARMNSKESKPIKLKQLCFVPDAHSCIEDATDDIHDVLSSVLWACQWNPRNKSRQLTYRTSTSANLRFRRSRRTEDARLALWKLHPWTRG